MDLEALRIFYVVAREKQITSATHHLGKTQPAITDRLKRFQKELGIQLYVAGKHGIVLTPSGELLFQKAQKILSDVENLKHALLVKNETKGHLCVSTTHALTSQVVVRALPRFRESYPDIDLTLLAEDKPVDLNLRESDVLIRPHMGEVPHLEQRFLMRFHLGLFASPEYLERNGTPKTVSDLENHIFLSYPENIVQPHSGVNWHLSLIKKQKRAQIITNSSHTLQKAAELGLGILSLSKEAITLNKTKVIPVLPDLEGPIVDIYYICIKNSLDDARINAFYDVLKHYLEEKGFRGNQDQQS